MYIIYSDMLREECKTQNSMTKKREREGERGRERRPNIPIL